MMRSVANKFVSRHVDHVKNIPPWFVKGREALEATVNRVLVDLGVMYCMSTATKDDCAIVPDHRLSIPTPVSTISRIRMRTWIGGTLCETVGLCVPEHHFAVLRWNIAV